jgi:hypothetical protein
LGLCASWQVNFRPQRGWRGSPHFRLCGEKGPLFGCSAKAGATGATYWTATTTLPAPLTVLCAHFGPRAKIQQKLAKETKNFVVFAGHCCTKPQRTQRSQGRGLGNGWSSPAR